MSIANELSSDVAAAVLARSDEGGPAESIALKEVVMRVHSTLRRLTREARKNGRSKLDPEKPATGRIASNGQ